MSAEPISEPRPRRAALYGGLTIFAIVYVLSAVVLVPRFYRNVLSFVTWNAVSCRMLESRLRSYEHRDDDGEVTTQYSLQVEYEYLVDGTAHRSTRYQFVESSSNWRSSWEREYARLPSGATTTCWVNPNDPGDAVLSRRLSFFYVILFFPLLGFVGFRAWKRWANPHLSSEPIAEAIRGPQVVVASPSGAPISPSPSNPVVRAERDPAVVEPKLTPDRNFVISLVWAIVLNAISAGIVAYAVGPFRAGTLSWELLAMLSVIPLLGLVAIGGTIHAALARRNPRVRVTITSTNLLLGSTASVGWVFEGATQSLRKLRITLRGRELAREVRLRPIYERERNLPPTESVESEYEFATIPVYESPGSTVSAVGSATFQVPADAMHTFTSPHGRIFWTLDFHGEIARWPDIHQEYEIVLWPPEPTGDE